MYNKDIYLYLQCISLHVQGVSLSQGVISSQGVKLSQGVIFAVPQLNGCY